MFAIEVGSREASGDLPGILNEAVGRIVIGDFEETFTMPLSYWSASDYRRSWRQAFDVLESGPNAKSCLMVSMTDPETSNFLTCWPMYRDVEAVYIYNAIILLDELEVNFDAREPWASIGPRYTIDEDGNKISEWETSMDSLRDFFK
jgi:CdiI N-terminal domain